MKKTVLDVAFRHTVDHVVGKPISGALLEDLVNMCVARASTGLERDAPGYTRDQKYRYRMYSSRFSQLIERSGGFSKT